MEFSLQSTGVFFMGAWVCSVRNEFSLSRDEISDLKDGLLEMKGTPQFCLFLCISSLALLLSAVLGTTWSHYQTQLPNARLLLKISSVFQKLLTCSWGILFQTQKIKIVF